MPSNRTREVEPAADRSAPTRGRLLLGIALAVVVAEALALVAAAGWWLVRLVAAGSDNLAVGLFIAAFCLGTAAVLVLAARSVRRGSRGGRSPLVAWQLLQGATSVAVLQVAQGSVAVVAWTALGVAVVVAVLLLTTMALTIPGPTAPAPAPVAGARTTKPGGTRGGATPPRGR